MLEDVLAAHFDAYPDMQPEDAVKLIHQSVFGPDTPIRDLRRAAEQLHLEISALPVDRPAPLYEPIGNGLCRLNLAACKARGIGEPVILRLLCDAAAAEKGDRKAFQRGLSALKALAQRGETPFEPIALDYFLLTYDEKRCPSPPHSAAYVSAYHPSYRVVAQKKLKDELKALRESKNAG